MNKREQIAETVATYRKHGWQLRRVLLTAATQAALAREATALLGELAPREAVVDALWFSRQSHSNREAWELRLVAEPPYALFLAFGANEAEAQREEARAELEEQMREYADAGRSAVGPQG
jgi:hypothetical protein